MPSVIPLLASFAAVALATPVTPIERAPTNNYCGFYSDSFCSHQSGSTTYSVNNNGVFQNGGAYFQCGTSYEFSLISYPAGDSGGTRPKHCHVFTADQADNGCTHLNNLGYTTGDGGYYRISKAVTCPAGTSKRDALEEKSVSEVEVEIEEREALPEAAPIEIEEREALPAANPIELESRDAFPASNETELEERAPADYLTFFNDPACSQRSGSVSYSINNQGCFQNGGAYFGSPSADYGWSVYQYAGTGNYQCTPSVEHCAIAGKITGRGCVHVDDTGLRSGQGSYKIVRGGCP